MSGGGGITDFLKDATEWHLCPISVAEMLYKWKHKPDQLPAPDPDKWLQKAVQGFKPALLNYESARQAALWEWVTLVRLTGF